jgi:hypothetical protein
MTKIEKLRLEIYQILKQKSIAFNNTLAVAKNVLQTSPANAYRAIKNAFKAYEIIDEQENKCLARLSKAKTEYPGIQHAIFNYRNIKDVYFKLSIEERHIWDAIPELKAWKEQFR